MTTSSFSTLHLLSGNQNASRRLEREFALLCQPQVLAACVFTVRLCTSIDGGRDITSNCTVCMVHYVFVADPG